MLSPMDNVPFMTAPQNQPINMEQMIQRAQQNPQAFEDYIRRTNPQGYQQALQIRNSANPRAITMQLAQQRGVNPIIMRMLGMM